jgi:cyclomaltodextrinase
VIRRFSAAALLLLIGACAGVAPPQESPWQDRVAQSLARHGTVAQTDPALVEVSFSYHPERPATTVSLTGDFAGWNPTGIPMADRDGDGTWTVTHSLRPGEYLYKFVVDSTEWQPDPNNPERVDDGHSGFNSVLHVRSETSGAMEHAERDGHVVAEMLYHSPASDASLRRTGPDSIQVTLRTLRGDADGVDLLFGSTGPPRHEAVDLIYSDDLFDYYRADVDLTPEELTGPLGYLFEVRDGRDVVELGADGPTRGDPGTAAPFVAEPAALEFRDAPSWAMDTVWYQIFPERFRNGDPSNDPKPTVPWTWEWSKPFNEGEARNFYRHVYERRYGGDLQGVIEELDYLQNLGVTGIYFNPVFEAESLHKYETSDYRHIDDNFGVLGDNKGLHEGVDPATWVFTPSDRLFLDLVRECHARGIHVIIDGVFNHCGRAHWAFQDVLAHGQDSPFAGWYRVTSWNPFEYVGWAGERDLPEWNRDENGLVEPVAQHIFAITRRWMDPNGDGDPSDGIDGWRLDVPNEIPKPFWRRWCALVREVNPDAYTTGELWGRNPDWTTPDLFDAHMDYEWLRGVYRFFINDGASASGEPVWHPTDLNRFLFQLQDAYGFRTDFVMQNLLDSHDTDRIASAIINPNRAVDQANRLQDSGPDYDASKPGPEAYRRLRLIQLFQFTALGAPMIYYGDEVGMWGADDPQSRKPMLWDDLTPYDNPLENSPDDGLRRHVAVLAHLRRDLPALRRGLLRPALLDDTHNVYAFERRLHPEPSLDDVYVALNRSGEAVTFALPVHWPDGTQTRNIYLARLLAAETGGEESEVPARAVESGSISLTLGPDQGAILSAVK